MTTVLRTSGPTKRFGEVTAVTAVRDVDLTVERGELLGLLGPNGAVRTTTLRVLLGLARPTCGSATVLGGTSGDPDVLSRVGATWLIVTFGDATGGVGAGAVGAGIGPLQASLVVGAYLVAFVGVGVVTFGRRELA